MYSTCVKIYLELDNFGIMELNINLLFLKVFFLTYGKQQGNFNQAHHYCKQNNVHKYIHKTANNVRRVVFLKFS